MRCRVFREAIGLVLVLVALIAALALPATRAHAASPPVIAAASSIKFAMDEIAEAFSAETGQSVALSYGSSGNLARQIRQGAPFEVFLSADEDFVLDLARDSFARDAGVVYARGRLAIVVPLASPLAPDGSLEDLAAALRAGRITRFAIASPAHAPYGQRAEEVLRRQGLWDAVLPKLVLGENIAQAAQFAVSGNADGGIVAASLVTVPRVAAQSRSALIPEAWHAPLRHRMTRLKAAGPVAEAFYAFLQRPAARAILRRHGLAPPQGAS